MKQKNPELLHSLQANILKPHGRNHVCFLLFRLGKDLQGLTAFLNYLEENSQYTITYADQLRDTRCRKKALKSTRFRKYINESLEKENFVLNLAFSAEFYTKLEKINEVSIRVRPSDPHFNLGLDDIGVGLPFYSQDFAEPYRIKKKGDGIEGIERRPFDLLLTLAHDSEHVLINEIKVIKNQAIVSMHIQDNDIIKEKGYGRHGKNDEGAKPLGYEDGLSEQRSIAELGSLTLARELYFTEDSDFGEDRQLPAYGTYVFFQKIGLDRYKFNCLRSELASYLENKEIEQTKKGTKFFEKIKQLTKEVTATTPEEMLAEALLMGRFTNGTPLILSGESINSFERFPFDYKDDPEGWSCPFQAHIRVVNPRSLGTNNASIVRRGAYYGDLEYKDPLPPEERKQPKGGLLFVSLQKSITVQLIPILLRMSIAGLTDGIAYGKKATKFKIPRSFLGKNQSHRAVEIDKVSRYIGGDFFYMPSLRSIQKYKDYLPTGPIV